MTHGTAQGYQTHRREGSVACSDCRDAWAEYMQVYRRIPTDWDWVTAIAPQVKTETELVAALKRPEVFWFNP